MEPFQNYDQLTGHGRRQMRKDALHIAAAALKAVDPAAALKRLVRVERGELVVPVPMMNLINGGKLTSNRPLWFSSYTTRMDTSRVSGRVGQQLYTPGGLIMTMSHHHHVLRRSPRRSPGGRTQPRLARRFAVTLLALGVLTFIAACGGSTGSSSSPSPTSTTAWTPSNLSVHLEAITTDPSLKAMLPSNVVSANNLRVAADIPYPPHEYFVSATSDQVTGFDYDLAQAIGKKIGIPVSFMNTPFDSLILAIKGGRRDVIMSCMSDTSDRRAEGITYVDYAWDGTAFLVRKGNPQGVGGPDSLVGKTVACIRGTTQQTLLEEWNSDFEKAGKEPMTILTLPNQPAALLAVSSDRAVADASDLSTLQYIADTTDNGNAFEVIIDPAVPQGYNPTLHGAGIAADNQELINVFQKALQALIDDGVYQQIAKTYGVPPVDSIMTNQGGKATPGSASTP